MSLPFIKVRCDEWLQRAALVQWGDQRAPVLWVEMDLAILTATGRLDDLSVRDLAKRWGWPRSTAARKVKEGVGRIWDSSGTLVGQERDTPVEVEPEQSGDVGTAVGQERDSSGTRAQSSIESSRGGEGGDDEEHTPIQARTGNSTAPLRTEASPTSVKAVWCEEAQRAGFNFAQPPSRKEHIAALGKVRSQLGPDMLRATIAAYMDKVASGEHWQRSRTPDTGPMVKDLQAWVELAQGGGTLPRVREMVAGLEGLVKRHAYLTHAVEGEPEEVAEQFKVVLETATGIDRTEVWARMRAANAWQFGKWTEAARAAM